MPTKFDNTNSNIEYIGSWATDSYAECYGGSMTYTTSTTSTANEIARFNFTGTSLALYSYRGINRTTALGVWIDGVLYNTYNLNGAETFQVLMFSITGLDNREHYCVMQNTLSSGRWDIDALELDTGSELKAYTVLGLKRFAQAIGGF